MPSHDLVDGRRLPAPHVWPPRRPAPKFVRATALTRGTPPPEEQARLDAAAEAQRVAQQQQQDEAHASFFPPARDDASDSHRGIGSSSSSSAVGTEVASAPAASALVDDAASTNRAGGSMAELYASLASVLPSPAVSVAIREPQRPAHRIAPSRRTERGPDWFGGRPGRGFLVPPPAGTAAAAASGSATKAELPTNDAQDAFCPLCQVVVPAAQARDHSTSIAHQLLLPLAAPAARGLRPAKAARASGEAAQDERLLLDARNRGYQALARMGWQEGMGLGEAEVRRLKEEEQAREAKAEEERQRAKQARQKVRERQAQQGEGSRVQPIELDSDDEMVQEAGASASLKRSPSASPPPAAPDADRPRARIVPLQPTARPDRRGIGTSLPSAPGSASAASRRRSTLNATAARHAELVRTGRRTESKSAKRERLERERQRARATRAMLNF